MYVKYAYEVRTRDPHYFDFTYQDKNYHGKYETARSPIRSLKYISKEDKEPLELGEMDYKHEIKARESHKRVYCKRLLDGEDIVDVVRDNPELLCGFGRL